MPFFQNPFHEDFEGNWVISDRRYVPKFVVGRNNGRGAEIVNSWNDGPYDLSGNDVDGNERKYLSICFSLHGNKNWATINLDITTTASSITSVTSLEIANALNANNYFSERFTAKISSLNTLLYPRVVVQQRKPVTEFKFYIINGKAEEALGFNARAGVFEIPTYFDRHTIENRFNFEDSVGMLIKLDPELNDVDANIIDNAVDYKGMSLGYSSLSLKEDWELLEGRSGIFQFTKGPSEGAVVSTNTTIIFSAGAKKGDLAKKIVVQKDVDGIVVAEFETPYTLTNSDLITPP
jgi:hypothetical protein